VLSRMLPGFSRVIDWQPLSGDGWTAQVSVYAGSIEPTERVDPVAVHIARVSFQAGGDPESYVCLIYEIGSLDTDLLEGTMGAMNITGGVAGDPPFAADVLALIKT